MACYGACLRWLLPELSLSDRLSRGTKLWERDWDESYPDEQESRITQDHTWFSGSKKWKILTEKMGKKNLQRGNNLKVSIRPTGFLWFWNIYRILKCIQAKKLNSNAFFAMKSSFKCPASAAPNEIDRVMEDWCRMTWLQEHLKA